MIPGNAKWPQSHRRGMERDMCPHPRVDTPKSLGEILLPLLWVTRLFFVTPLCKSQRFGGSRKKKMSQTKHGSRIVLINGSIVWGKYLDALALTNMKIFIIRSIPAMKHWAVTNKEWHFLLSGYQNLNFITYFLKSCNFRTSVLGVDLTVDVSRLQCHPGLY